MRRFVLLALLAGCGMPSAPASSPSDSPSGRPGLNGLDRLVADAGNAARERAGVGPLAWRDDLAALARAHSHDMATRDFFSHVTPDGQTPNDRAADAEVACRVPIRGRIRIGVSENLFVTSRFRRYADRTAGGRVTRTYDWFSRNDLADRTVQGWLDSPDHRRSLLDPDTRAQGIGVAAGTADRVFVTQMLC